MVLLGLLVLVALAPIVPMQSRGYPLVPRLIAIACAFTIGQLFRGAADHAAGVGAYLGAVVLAALPWGLYLRVRHRESASDGTN